MMQNWKTIGNYHTQTRASMRGMYQLAQCATGYTLMDMAAWSTHYVSTQRRHAQLLPSYRNVHGHKIIQYLPSTRGTIVRYRIGSIPVNHGCYNHTTAATSMLQKARETPTNNRTDDTKEEVPLALRNPNHSCSIVLFGKLVPCPSTEYVNGSIDVPCEMQERLSLAEYLGCNFVLFHAT